MARTKTNIQNNKKHTEHQDATDIQIKTTFCDSNVIHSCSGGQISSFVFNEKASWYNFT